MATGPVPAVGPTPAAALSSLPGPRRAVLVALKDRGDAFAEDLALDLGVTVSALRQQLSSLQSDGLVVYEESREPRGRPKHRYHLTDAGDELFPRGYDELANELLEYLSDSDAALVEKLFRRRRDRRIRQASLRLAGKDLAARVEELAAILDEDGYVASFEANEDGTFLVIEHNCALLSVARTYGQACTSEVEFIRSVLPEADVTRVSHIVAGARHCAYRIAPRERRAPAWA